MKDWKVRTIVVDPSKVRYFKPGESMAKIIEAFRQTVLRYRAAKQPIPLIPWDEVEVPNVPGAKVLHPSVRFSAGAEA